MKTLITVLLSAASLMILFGSPSPQAAVPDRTLTFAERVSYQRVIEEVYWRHRIWPKENPDPKPSLDAVMSQAQLENKVQEYVRKSQALEDCWKRPITADQLQAEMDRMAKDTKQPEVLHELFEALGNDPFVIAECLAWPALSERLLTNCYAQDQRFYGELKLARAENQTPNVVAAVNANYVLPTISDGGCTDDTWAATNTSNAPERRDSFTAVWTGSEMIVWGGSNGIIELSRGGKYNPSIDTWTATSTTNAPTARTGHTAVWTGSEMIVWGGRGNNGSYLNKGGRYNPATSTWTATSTTNAPTARSTHTAVWAGSEMIVWGGTFYDFNIHYLNTGGRYNPGTNSWASTSIVNAPSARGAHTAVWTGNEMIIWGGFFDGETSFLNTGGRYNPSTNSWTATSTTNADPRAWHTVVWTGSEMIVWGGDNAISSRLNTGGKYSPSTDSWVATSTINAPDGRSEYPAVWTGSEMIVWGGGINSPPYYLNTGGRYNPSTDFWTATSTTNAPDSRSSHTAVWTGSEMIVWGGLASDAFGTHWFNTGGRYCAQSGPPPTPTPTATATATPTPTATATATPTSTPTATATATFTPTPTATFTPTPTATATATATATFTPTPTATFTPTPTPTATATATPTATPTATATATPSPAVTTNPATNVASVFATLNGSVNPRGSTTTVYFQWGTTTSYGHTTPAQTQTGNTYRPITANIIGLRASRLYHFRIVATNGGGTSFGPDRTFTTLGAPPVVTTNPATFVASNSFTANWRSVSGATGYRLDVATNNSFTNYVAGYQNLNVGNALSRSVTGLSANTNYYYRVRAYNGNGTSGNSNVVHVTTLSPTGFPVAITNPATLIASFSAKLNGTVDPHGLSTTVYFQYGRTTSYGNRTPNQTKTGNNYQNVFANISGLSAHTTYHFRIVATNAFGTRYGTDRTLTTQ